MIIASCACPLQTRTWEEALSHLPEAVRASVRCNIPLARYTTLRVGGPADLFIEAYDTDTLTTVVSIAQRFQLPHFVLGEGSNICVSDAGVRGLVVRNACQNVQIGTITCVDCGYNLMRLFQKSLHAGLSGLEFAVGIPGTVGGALVSNAGAYRSNICELVQRIEVVEQGERRWVGPEWMEFSYRDSRLRRGGKPPATLLSVQLRLTPGSRARIRSRARELQLQRIRKQPWQPSAGSFFKNVYDRALAESLPGLPQSLREAGVVPAAYLSEACGFKGLTIGRAGVSVKHANFIVNLGGATATDIRAVAQIVKQGVLDRFGVLLEEEVLYVGAWPNDIG